MAGGSMLYVVCLACVIVVCVGHDVGGFFNSDVYGYPMAQRKGKSGGFGQNFWNNQNGVGNDMWNDHRDFLDDMDGKWDDMMGGKERSKDTDPWRGGNIGRGNEYGYGHENQGQVERGNGRGNANRYGERDGYGNGRGRGNGGGRGNGHGRGNGGGRYGYDGQRGNSGRHRTSSQYGYGGRKVNNWNNNLGNDFGKWPGNADFGKDFMNDNWGEQNGFFGENHGFGKILKSRHRYPFNGFKNSLKPFRSFGRAGSHSVSHISHSSMSSSSDGSGKSISHYSSGGHRRQQQVVNGQRSGSQKSYSKGMRVNVGVNKNGERVANWRTAASAKSAKNRNGKWYDLNGFRGNGVGRLNGQDIPVAGKMLHNMVNAKVNKNSFLELHEVPGVAKLKGRLGQFIQSVHGRPSGKVQVQVVKNHRAIQ